MLKALYTIPELARLAGVSTKTIRRILARNKIAGIKCGGNGGSGGGGGKRYIPITQLAALDYDLYFALSIAENSQSGTETSPNYIGD